MTLAYLAYLGYPHTAATSTTPLPSTSALLLTRPRKQDRKKGTVQRQVFLGYVLGAAGSGKTALLKSFVSGGGGAGRRGLGRHEPTMGKGKTVVNSVETGGGEKYLVVSRCSLRCRNSWPRLELIQSLLGDDSFKNLAATTRARCSVHQRSLLWPTCSFLSTTRAIPTLSATSQTCG